MPKYLITIEGPCKDYDYSTFCEDHCNDAIDFLSSWGSDLIDMIEPNEVYSLTIKCRDWLPNDRCYVCNPLTEYERDD